MNKIEAVKLLSILKATYPNSYKNMSKEDASGTVTIWAMQFSKVPISIMFLAVNQWISQSQFPPAISDIKMKITTLKYEAKSMIRNHYEAIKPITEEEKASYIDLYKRMNKEIDDTQIEQMLRNKSDVLDYTTLQMLEEFVKEDAQAEQQFSLKNALKSSIAALGMGDSNNES